MKRSLLRWQCALACALAVLMVPVVGTSESPRPGKKFKIHDKVVDLFDGMEAGEIEVRFIAKDATQANVLIENKTGQPITVRLPDAFAGVPVLAQFGGGGGGLGGGGLGGGGFGGGGGGLGGGGGGGGGQGLGGGFGGGGGGLGGGGGGLGGGGLGGGGGGGLFNVAAEKTGKIKVKTVCLEHGKPDPNPNHEYKIIPIDMFTDKQEVVELCRMLAREEIPQNTAQAAAWHLANDMSWEELAAKDRVRLMNGYVEKFFSIEEIQLAVRVVTEASRRVEERRESEKSDSPGYQSSTQTALKN